VESERFQSPNPRFQQLLTAPMPTTITPLLPSVPPPALGLGLGLRRSVSEGVGPPPRPLVAPPSAAGGGPRPALQQLQQQWRASVSVEDRQEIRKKIRQAYSSTCPTYEDLLQLVVAIDEEVRNQSISRVPAPDCG
jgi:hypothetical protein